MQTYTAPGRTVTSQMIADTMCGAFEGGSTYWCDQADLTVIPAGCENPAYADPKFYEGDFEFKLWADNEWHTVNPEKLRAGLGLMQKTQPRHFEDMITGQGDATTADVLLQFATFGEVVYG